LYHYKKGLSIFFATFFAGLSAHFMGFFLYTLPCVSNGVFVIFFTHKNACFTPFFTIPPQKF